jgi:hypothetical protein
MLNNTCKEVNENMNEDIDEKVGRYAQLLECAAKKTRDTASAIAVFQEVLKDEREESHYAKQVFNGDAEPTDSQIEYLKRLGATIPDKLTRQKASELIDDTKKMRAQLIKAIERPVRVP